MELYWITVRKRGITMFSTVYSCYFSFAIIVIQLTESVTMTPQKYVHKNNNYPVYILPDGSNQDFHSTVKYFSEVIS